MKRLTISLMLVAATAFAFNVNAADNLSQGKNYHLIFLDDVSAAKIPASKITKDYRINNTTNLLSIWSDTYTDLGSSDLNSEGENKPYINFQLANPWWSAFSFYSTAGNGKDCSTITRDLILHLAMKSTDTQTHCIRMEAPGCSVRSAIGATDFVDGSIITPVYTDFPRDGQWHVIEIPMSVFFDQGLYYSEPVLENFFVLLSGGFPGTTISLDAIFIYEKDLSAAVNNIKADLSLTQTKKTITVQSAMQGFKLYSTTGEKVKETNETIMGIEDLQKGVYIVRCGQLSKKIIIY